VQQKKVEINTLHSSSSTNYDSKQQLPAIIHHQDLFMTLKSHKRGIGGENKNKTAQPRSSRWS